MANVSNCSPIRSARCTARTSAESPGSDSAFAVERLTRVVKRA
jgi:hypothetical protein